MSQTAAPFKGVSGVAGNRTFPRIGQLRGQGVGAVLVEAVPGAMPQPSRGRVGGRSPAPDRRRRGPGRK